LGKNRWAVPRDENNFINTVSLSNDMSSKAYEVRLSDCLDQCKLQALLTTVTACYLDREQCAYGETQTIGGHGDIFADSNGDGTTYCWINWINKQNSERYTA